MRFFVTWGIRGAETAICDAMRTVVIETGFPSTQQAADHAPAEEGD